MADPLEPKQYHGVERSHDEDLAGVEAADRYDPASLIKPHLAPPVDVAIGGDFLSDDASARVDVRRDADAEGSPSS